MKSHTCLIKYKNGLATGISINEKYIITALHLFKDIQQKQLKIVDQCVQSNGFLVKKWSSNDLALIQRTQTKNIPPPNIYKNSLNNCLGQNITNIGYGNPYRINPFNPQPLTHNGIISKIIYPLIKCQCICYSGSSGSGIWNNNQQLMGMMLFNLRWYNQSLYQQSFALSIQCIIGLINGGQQQPIPGMKHRQFIPKL